MNIAYDKDRDRWVAYMGGHPVASSRRKEVLTGKYPSAIIDRVEEGVRGTIRISSSSGCG